MIIFSIVSHNDGLKSDSVRSNGQSSDILTLLKKIESFGPYFEAMQQDTKKLAGQVEECRGLSDRLSGMVGPYPFPNFSE